MVKIQHFTLFLMLIITCILNIINFMANLLHKVDGKLFFYHNFCIYIFLALKHHFTSHSIIYFIIHLIVTIIIKFIIQY